MTIADLYKDALKRGLADTPLEVMVDMCDVRPVASLSGDADEGVYLELQGDD